MKGNIHVLTQDIFHIHHKYTFFSDAKIFLLQSNSSILKLHSEFVQTPKHRYFKTAFTQKSHRNHTKITQKSQHVSCKQPKSVSSPIILYLVTNFKRFWVQETAGGSSGDYITAGFPKRWKRQQINHEAFRNPWLKRVVQNFQIRTRLVNVLKCQDTVKHQFTTIYRIAVSLILHCRSHLLQKHHCRVSWCQPGQPYLGSQYYY